MAALLASPSGLAMAQTGFRSPSGLSTVGASGPSRGFASNSFGAGSLSSYSPAGPGGNLLRSSMTVGGAGMRGGVASGLTAAPLSVRSGLAGLAGASGAPAGVAAPMALAGQQYSQNMPGLAAPDAALTGLGYAATGDPMAAPADSQAPSPIAASSMIGFAQLYLESISQQGALEQQDVVVTSLVPPGASGPFAERLKDGEHAMKQRSYRRASQQFDLAYVLDRQSPEALLSLVHARLGTALGSYREPARYLEQAIRYLPELPLVRMNLKSMFAEPDELHTGVLPPLLARAAQDPDDAGAYLLLAYVLWFDSNPAAAQDALAIARGVAKSEDTTEAIDTFWDGMKAAGLVGGDLQPNSQLRLQRLVLRPDAIPPASAPQP